MFTVPLFVCGFIPVVGQTAAVPFYRRGMDLRQRRQLLGKRRALALGLGTPVALLCAIPLAAILVMPVAVAGGVLVAHETFATRGSAVAETRPPAR